MVAISAAGARALVAMGLAIGAAGMGLIAGAQSAVALFAGAILTGISPGLVFAPLADAITAGFEPQRRGPAFAIVNAGEGAGAIAAGLLFFAAAADWRAAWLAFCLLALAVLAPTALSIPRGSVGADAAHEERASWQTLIARQSWPLHYGSLVVGAGTTVLWTYAGVLVDGASMAGVELRVALWIAMGAAGVAAVVVAPILEAFGLRWTYAASIVLTASSAIGLALAQGAVTALIDRKSVV